MALPFKALSLTQLQRQYQRMLKIKFRFSVPPGPKPRPGELYSCIFDSEDGLRLIISKEKIINDPSGKVWPWTLHVSASAHGPMKLAHDSPDFLSLVPVRLMEISGTADQFQFFGFPHGSKCPHWGRNLEQRSKNNVRE